MAQWTVKPDLLTWWWWWLFPRLREFGENVWPFILRLCSTHPPPKCKLAQMFHSLCQDESTVAQRAETTVAECSLTSCVWARFPIGSHTMPGQRHSQPTPTSLSQGVCQEVTGKACWLECRTHYRKVVSLNPARSGGRIFFSRVNFVCWLLFGVHSTPLLPQWHVKDPGHFAKSAGGRLHLDTRTIS